MAGDSFDGLTPDIIIDAAETALNCRFEGVTIPYPSYINRVYELRRTTGEPVVAKFYRPGRWSFDALSEEHEFMFRCAEADIPLAAPLKLNGGLTLGVTGGGIYFALFPKKAGRRFEPLSKDDWVRLGMLAGRIHNAGSGMSAVARPLLTPEALTGSALKYLESVPFIPAGVKERLRSVTERIIAAAAPEFADIELIPVHGDLHGGNILARPDAGLSVIDFDDMAVAPAAQDLWLLLPGYAGDCYNELALLLDGYRRFRDIDEPSYSLLESLRAMRMIYYLAWCARQKGDFMFERNFPDWGSTGFWRTELEALEEQLNIIENGGSGRDEIQRSGEDSDMEENWLY